MRLRVIAPLSRGSHDEVLLTAAFCLMLAKGLRKQTASKPVARDFYTRLETKPSSTAAEVASRDFNRGIPRHYFARDIITVLSRTLSTISPCVSEKWCFDPARRR